MDNNPKGPYKHYERPTERRADNERPSGGHWGAVICVLVIILAVLIPVVHHLSANNIQHAEQPKEVERVKKTDSSAKTKKVKKHKKNKKLKKAKKNNTLLNNNDQSNDQSQSSDQSSSNSKSKEKTYVVEDGDTISSIAADHGMSADELAQLNGLDDSSSIDAGQTLKLK